MTPPGAGPPRAVFARPDEGSGDAPLLRIVKRSDYLRAARAAYRPRPGLVLQARRRDADEAVPEGAVRVGITCSRKVGNAVARNRAKRRLRAAARDVLPDLGRPGWDYVLIGRAGMTGQMPFDRLLGDLRAALARIHG